MALTSRDLIDLADRRIEQVQKKLHPSTPASSVVFRGQHGSDVLPLLEALQLYVDQLLVDRSFPWELHWAALLTEHQDEPPAAPKSLDGSRRWIDSFVQRFAPAVRSSAAAQRGTVEEIRLGVLVHLSTLMRKLFNGGAILAATEVPDGAVTMDPVVAPSAASGATTMPPPTTEVTQRSPPPVVLASSEQEQVTAAPKPQPPSGTPRRPRTAAHPTSKMPTNQTPDRLRTVVDGIEYVSVNMNIANSVCRPNSAWTLNPGKREPVKVVAMVHALERNAGAVNAKCDGGPLFSVPTAVSRWRTNSTTPAADGDQPSTPRIDGTHASEEILSSSKPSIRKPRPTVPTDIPQTQVPVSGVVQAVGRGGAVVMPATKWSHRDDPQHCRVDARGSRWVLVSHEAAATGAMSGGRGAVSATARDIVRHSQTVALTSALTSTRPSAVAHAQREVRELKGSWAPQHDAKWVAPVWSDAMSALDA